MWFLTVALAAPVQHSTEALNAEVAVQALTADTCAPVLEGFFSDLRSITPDQVDATDAAQHGPATVQTVWRTRQALQSRLAAFHTANTLTEDCVTAARRADLASRYLVDHLFQLHPETDAWLTSEAFGSIDDLQSGDVLVTRGSKLASAGIAHIGAVDSQFSHNAMVYVDPAGMRWTIEAYLEKGALVQPLEEFLSHGLGRIVVVRHRDTALAATAAEKAYTRVSQGKPIQYDEAFRSDDGGEELFCSEIGPWAFGMAGGPSDLPLFPTRFPHDRTPQLFAALGIETGFIAAPADLLYDPRFDVVAEWRDVPDLETLRRQDAVVESLFRWMERDGYGLDPSWSNRATVDVGLTLRRTPILGKALDNMVHPDGDRQFLVAGLALQQAGQLVYDALELHVGDAQPTWDSLKGELEQIRADDHARWRTRPRKSGFHRVLHPPAETKSPRPGKQVLSGP